MLWYDPQVSGPAPAPRSGHTASLLGTDIVYFGGARRRKWTSDVVVLDTQAWKWVKPKITGRPPTPRVYHSATVVGDRIVRGGWGGVWRATLPGLTPTHPPTPHPGLAPPLQVVFGGNDETRSFNDVHVLNTGVQPWQWEQPCVVGTPPAPRTGHTAAVVGSGYVLVHGGWDPQVGDEDGAEEGRELLPYNDAFVLDTGGSAAATRPSFIHPCPPRSCPPSLHSAIPHTAPLFPPCSRLGVATRGRVRCGR